MIKSQLKTHAEKFADKINKSVFKSLFWRWVDNSSNVSPKPKTTNVEVIVSRDVHALKIDALVDSSNKMTANEKLASLITVVEIEIVTVNPYIGKA